MNSRPLVSVVMNCLNGQRYLREAIDSVFAQTFAQWEMIFWDNASSDDTGQIALSYAHDRRFRYFRAPATTPLGAARNLALKNATGAYVGFLDADDVYLPEMLAKQVALMESGDFGFVYGGTIVIDEKGREIGRRRLRNQSGWILDALLRKYEVMFVSVLLRRSVLERAGLSFNGDLSYSPDYDLLMRIAAQCPVGVLREYIVKYRRVSDSLSRRTLHLVSREVGYTLTELERLYPQALRGSADALAAARAKLLFFDAVGQVNEGHYAAARTCLRSVLWRRWEYLVIYLVLFFPVPRRWVLRALNR